MLNKTRIATMTKMSICEKGYGKKNIHTSEYFMLDYISKNIVISLMWLTLLYLIMVVAIAVYKFDYILSVIVEDQLNVLMSIVGFGMLLMWLIFSVTFYFVYNAHYKNAQKKTLRYYKEMKRLNHIYTKEAEHERNL